MTYPHDYTADDRSSVPFDENPDDFLIGNVMGAEKSADELEKENSFVPMPAGDHLLIVAGFIGKPEPIHTKVMVNGQLSAYSSHSILVRFCLPNNERCTISDFFVLPPDSPAELRAYYDGTPEGRKQAGWAASKFIHFLNRIGFVWLPGQPIPEAARRLGNWKGRAVHATVRGPEPYTDSKTGEQKMGKPQIKSFSYRAASEVAEGHAAARSTTQAIGDQLAGQLRQQSGSPAVGTGRPMGGAGAGRQPAMAGAGAGAGTGGGRRPVPDNGLDSI